MIREEQTIVIPTQEERMYEVTIENVPYLDFNPAADGPKNWMGKVVEVWDLSKDECVRRDWHPYEGAGS